MTTAELSCLCGAVKVQIGGEPDSWFAAKNDWLIEDAFEPLRPLHIISVATLATVRC